jgi:C_GCAxxG_C_C family probable redox protein
MDADAAGMTSLEPMVASPEGSGASACRRARELFLDDRNVYGCAETAFVVLKEAFGLPEPADSSAAMALNGGIAYSGGTCGAVTGAALALGMLAERRIPDHKQAKRTARLLTAGLLADLAREFGATDCRALTGFDLRTEAGHRAFIEDGAWRDGCRRQVELTVGRSAALADGAAWEARLLELADATVEQAPVAPASDGCTAEDGCTAP